MSSGPVQAGLAQLPCACCLGGLEQRSWECSEQTQCEDPMGALPRTSHSVCLVQLGPGGWSWVALCRVKGDVLGGESPAAA